MKINSLSSGLSIPNKTNYSNSNNSFSVGSDSTQALSTLSEMQQLISPNAPKVADQQTNSITIKPGEVKNIGSVDGSPLNIYFGPNEMSTSFEIMINVNDPPDSPRNQLALKALSDHTPSQFAKANSIVSRFQLLYAVANGTMSVKQYNATNLDQAVSTSELLTSLGIDVSKSFSFNGKSFSLDAQGNLHALLPANQLNITQ
ncbi:hypothetical protein REC12_01395 [Desulfosporosinus sp. PR]|uniref:hypothetical protein n=1 Tax=Candidatus Desulfosporosinus nitrosoreducens TaxID=3401928 RepID=UPI0027F936F0|nr:hypothetical protein [Desulfosporosinus sp. PR]MDQ7092245.1 hypothetical protein [Desulfosporosinus sp. PR]